MIYGIGTDLIEIQRIERVLATEPDRGAGFMSFAPRVMMNMADLASTGLVQPASRVSWRMAVAGSDAAVGQFLPWAQAEADKRAKSQNAKRELALRRKAEVEKRNAEKAASGKPPPAALKVPPAASNP